MMMLPHVPISLLTPLPGCVGGAAVATARVWMLARRRAVALPIIGMMLGAVLLAAAAATPVWLGAGADRFTVMVDLSPSTRGADYRHRERLADRVTQILGNTSVDFLAFGESNAPLSTAPVLDDLAATETVFSPPPGQPVLLFSDGQFELPASAPPIFAVVDPQLIEPDDSAVTALEMNQASAVASIHHAGTVRQATWSGGAATQSIRIDDSIDLTAKCTGAGSIRLSLNGGDRWPENDSLTAVPPPPERQPRWWIGGRDAGAGWTQLKPANLPSSPVDWLNPSIVVLDNLPADALTGQQQDAMQRYARDFGGCVILVGGDHAFAAGAYGASSLGAISPLSDAPPTPSARWVLLIDSSGSMAAPATGGGSLFDLECSAARTLLPLLPSADLVQVGGFHRSVDWWIGSSAAAAAGQPLPPANAAPNGPTLLEPALRAALQPGTIPTQLLLMTDADTDPLDIDSFTAACTAAHARLNVLALGRGRSLASLAEVARRTGGDVREQPDPARWATTALDLLRAQLPDGLQHQPVDVRFVDEWASLGHVQTALWNRAWLKRDATAVGTAGDVPMAARWSVGSGTVAAIAFAMPAADVEQLADRLARPAADPRFVIQWNTSQAKPQVSVRAVDHGRFLNQQNLRLLCTDYESDALPPAVEVTQIGPGRYSAELPASDHARVVAVMLGEQVLDRRAIAGRYPAEFDHIGLNRNNLRELAQRTGGRVIDPADHLLVRSSLGRAQVDLSNPLLGLGLASMAAGLWHWQRDSR